MTLIDATLREGERESAGEGLQGAPSFGYKPGYDYNLAWKKGRKRGVYGFVDCCYEAIPDCLPSTIISSPVF
jgi:hypothetical protein